MPHRILVVDDEMTAQRLIAAAVEDAGYQAIIAKSGREALQLLGGPGKCEFDAVMLDLSMPEIDGFEVLKQAQPRHPSLPFIVLTAHSSIANAVASMRAGASDFLVKPASAQRIQTAIANVLGNRSLKGELRPLTERLNADLSFSELVGNSSAMREAVTVAKKAAASNIPVLIEGESGVGKELFARAIVEASNRAKKPFVTVNCGAIPRNLVESILFGHEKGSFTGATERHMGKFTEANGGTIFLDEVGELPLDIQVKLLRVLQEGEVDSVGGRDSSPVDVRVISATNRVLADDVRANVFREDLYYRLAVFPVRIPPLRRRREDIPELAQHFIERFAQAESVKVRGIAPTALTLLQDYQWPGNVRQLQNAIFRAAVLSDSDILEPRDFPFLMSQVESGENFTAPPITQPAAANPGWSGSLPVLDEQGHIRLLGDIEADIIRFALSRYKGRMSEIARRLGIGRSTLYRKVADLGLGENTEDDIEDDVVIPSQSQANRRAGDKWPH